MHSRLRACVIVGLGVSLSSTPVVGQELAEKEFPKANATLKDGIKSVRSIREQRDGRVLVSGGNDQPLLLADFSSGKAELRIKTGAEDDEVRTMGPLWAWSGDSTASFDAGKARLMLFGPDGSLARTMGVGSAPPSASPGGAPPGGGRGPRIPSMRYLVGTETAIGVGFPARPASPPNPALAPPRLPYPVVRYSLKTLRFDTIAQLMPAQSPRPPLSPNSSNAGTMVVYIGTAPVQSVDVWAAYADGTVAVVRAATYRIEWFSPDGSRTSAEPVAYAPIPVTSGDRKRVVEEFKRAADAALQSNPMRTAILAINYDEPASWPTTHPPFRGDIAPLVDARDRLWLATRCNKDEQSLCYDVIDRSGVRVDRYKLPPRTMIVGFGKDVVYTFVDSKDILQRHPLTSSP
ncbi:MAG: hypothetical protein IPP90_01690 [Gemmatimonadaceae bacterium]|nr:hypothetical protein [Gemmatimonadaceae bacterium]